MIKLINKIGLGNLILLIWGLILPTIAIGITCYVKGWLFTTTPPTWFQLILTIYTALYIAIIIRIVLNIVFGGLALIFIIIETIVDFIRKMNKTKLCVILLLFFGVSSQAQVCREYTCTFQNKQYTVSIGVFSPNDDGSIVIKKEKPNGEFTLKSYDFFSYTPSGYLFVEKGNSERRVILEKDLYNHITGITFLYKEEKFLYKPITK